MKKFLSLLLVCLMVVPFGMLAGVSVMAADKTVYVSDAGNDANDGSAADKAVQTLPRAYQLLGAAGGTVVVNGTVTIVGYENKMPDHTGLVTVKGANAASKIAVGDAETRFFLGGPTKFTDITFECETTTLLVVFRYFDVEFTDTFKYAGSKKMFLVAGQGGNETKPSYNYTPKDCTVTVNGGYWHEMAFGPRSGFGYVDDAGAVATKTADEFKDYKITANIGGNATIEKLFLLSRTITQDIVAANSSLTLNLNGGVISYFAGVNDQKSRNVGYENGVAINIGKDFDISKQFEGHGKNIDANRIADGIYYGLSGETLYDRSIVSYTQELINGTLTIDKDVYDAILASGKVSVASFKEVKSTDGTVAPAPETTEAPETTKAPETSKAPTTTKAPATTTKAPETTAKAPETTAAAPAQEDGGINVGVIIAIAAVVVVAGAVVVVIVIKKKKAA